MRSDLDCLVCLMKQALNAVRFATEDKLLQREVINRVALEVQKADLDQSPAELSTLVYKIVSEVTGDEDPYKLSKQKSNKEALQLLPVLGKMITKSEDPIHTALHIAAAGNIIDLGIGQEFDLQHEIDNIVHNKFTVDHTEQFKNELQPGRKLLYLGDNSGEIVFDRILVQEILKKDVEITFIVKSNPIINDAMMDDAHVAGITDLVRVIETGSGDIGVNLDHSSDELRKLIENADVILAKGHGNFETCDELPFNIYFLLKAKCLVVARALGVNVGDLVLKRL